MVRSSAAARSDHEIAAEGLEYVEQAVGADPAHPLLQLEQEPPAYTQSIRGYPGIGEPELPPPRPHERPERGEVRDD